MIYQFYRSKWYSILIFVAVIRVIHWKQKLWKCQHRKLAEPITDKNGIVQFAGETTTGEHYSCVYGTMGTGWRGVDQHTNFLQLHNYYYYWMKIKYLNWLNANFGHRFHAIKKLYKKGKIDFFSSILLS